MPGSSSICTASRRSPIHKAISILASVNEGQRFYRLRYIGLGKPQNPGYATVAAPDTDLRGRALSGSPLRGLAHGKGCGIRRQAQTR